MIWHLSNISCCVDGVPAGCFSFPWSSSTLKKIKLLLLTQINRHSVIFEIKILQKWIFISVPYVKIIGDREVFVRSGSSVTLKCQISNCLDKPSYVFWYYGEGDDYRILDDSDRIPTKMTTTTLTTTTPTQPTSFVNGRSPAGSDSTSFIPMIFQDNSRMTRPY